MSNSQTKAINSYSQSLFESRTISYDSSAITDNNKYNRFRARRIRLRLSGNQSYPGFSYRLQLNLAESEADDGLLSNILWDAWLGYNINKTNKIVIGQKGTPTDNIELQMASNSLQLPERSKLTSAFCSIREVGMFLDGISAVVLTMAIIEPMIRQAGFDMIWFGIYLVVVVEMAQITPPVGFNLFVLQGMAEKDMGFIARSAFPLFLLMIFAVIIIIAFPQLALWLPEQMIQSLK